MDIVRIIARALWSLAVCDGDVRFQRANIVCRLHPRIAVLAVRHGVADALPTEERRTEAVLLSRDLQRNPPADRSALTCQSSPSTSERLAKIEGA